MAMHARAAAAAAEAAKGLPLGRADSALPPHSPGSGPGGKGQWGGNELRALGEGTAAAALRAPTPLPQLPFNLGRGAGAAGLVPASASGGNSPDVEASHQSAGLGSATAQSYHQPSHPAVLLRSVIVQGSASALPAPLLQLGPAGSVEDRAAGAAAATSRPLQAAAVSRSEEGEARPTPAALPKGATSWQGADFSDSDDSEADSPPITVSIQQLARGMLGQGVELAEGYRIEPSPPQTPVGLAAGAGSPQPAALLAAPTRALSGAAPSSRRKSGAAALSAREPAPAGSQVAGGGAVAAASLEGDGSGSGGDIPWSDDIYAEPE